MRFFAAVVHLTMTALLVVGPAPFVDAFVRPASTFGGAVVRGGRALITPWVKKVSSSSGGGGNSTIIDVPTPPSPSAEAEHMMKPKFNSKFLQGLSDLKLKLGEPEAKPQRRVATATEKRWEVSLKKKEEEEKSAVGEDGEATVEETPAADNGTKMIVNASRSDTPAPSASKVDIKVEEAKVEQKTPADRDGDLSVVEIESAPPASKVNIKGKEAKVKVAQKEEDEETPANRDGDVTLAEIAPAPSASKVDIKVEEAKAKVVQEEEDEKTPADRDGDVTVAEVPDANETFASTLVTSKEDTKQGDDLDFDIEDIDELKWKISNFMSVKLPAAMAVIASTALSASDKDTDQVQAPTADIEERAKLKWKLIHFAAVKLPMVTALLVSPAPFADGAKAVAAGKVNDKKIASLKQQLEEAKENGYSGVAEIPAANATEMIVDETRPDALAPSASKNASLAEELATKIKEITELKWKLVAFASMTLPSTIAHLVSKEPSAYAFIVPPSTSGGGGVSQAPIALEDKVSSSSSSNFSGGGGNTTTVGIRSSSSFAQVADTMKASAKRLERNPTKKEQEKAVAGDDGKVTVVEFPAANETEMIANETQSALGQDTKLMTKFEDATSKVKALGEESDLKVKLVKEEPVKKRTKPKEQQVVSNAELIERQDTRKAQFQTKSHEGLAEMKSGLDQAKTESELEQLENMAELDQEMSELWAAAAAKWLERNPTEKKAHEKAVADGEGEVAVAENPVANEAELFVNETQSLPTPSASKEDTKLVEVLTAKVEEATAGAKALEEESERKMKLVQEEALKERKKLEEQLAVSRQELEEAKAEMSERQKLEEQLAIARKELEEAEVELTGVVEDAWNLSGDETALDSPVAPVVPENENADRESLAAHIRSLADDLRTAKMDSESMLLNLQAQARTEREELEDKIISLTAEAEEAKKELAQEMDVSRQLRLNLDEVRATMMAQLVADRAESSRELKEMESTLRKAVEEVQVARTEERREFQQKLSLLDSELANARAVVERLRTELDAAKRVAPRAPRNDFPQAAINSIPLPPVKNITPVAVKKPATKSAEEAAEEARIAGQRLTEFLTGGKKTYTVAERTENEARLAAERSALERFNDVSSRSSFKPVGYDTATFQKPAEQSVSGYMTNAYRGTKTEYRYTVEYENGAIDVDLSAKVLRAVDPNVRELTVGTAVEVMSFHTAALVAPWVSMSRQGGVGGKGNRRQRGMIIDAKALHK